MFRWLKHYISVTNCFSRLAIQRQMEYPTFLFGWIAGNFLQWFGGLWLIQTIMSRFGDLAGWKADQVIFIYSLSVISHGLVVIFFLQTWVIGQMIIVGEFDRILLRPMDSFFLFIVRNINFVGITDAIPGIIIFFHACSLVKFHWSFVNIVNIGFILIGATLIRTALYMLVGSISFWKINRDALSVLMMHFQQQVTSYPISIYPYSLQVIFTFLIPIGFISFYPASQFFKIGTILDIPFNFSFATLLMGIIFFFLASYVFTTGLKKYESVGN